jgi:hypothetical protein
MTLLRMLAVLCATVVWAESCKADCSSLHALAQQHANDMTGAWEPLTYLQVSDVWS